MIYKPKDIVLIKFPFTNLSSNKQRPALIISDVNENGDFNCLQITSKNTQNNLVEIDNNNLIEGTLKLKSFVKLNKCSTLSINLINKKIATISNDKFLELKKSMCNLLFVE